MYNGFEIDNEMYELLLRWGIAFGYQVRTNETGTLLYGLYCKDPIRIKELEAEGKEAHKTRVEAEEIVNCLCNYRGAVESYKPNYNPPVRLDEDMYDNYFMPYLKEQGIGEQVYATHEGIFWGVHKVRMMVDPTCETCRSEVTELVRDLEFKRRIPRFIIKYQRGATMKCWLKDIWSMEEAEAILEREKPRHVPAADWKIYKDLTAELRHLDEVPAEAFATDEWLWMRIWHPGQYGADYWTHGLYDNLKDQRMDMIAEEALDIYSVTSLYACVRHDPPPEEEGAAPSSKWHLVATVSRPDDAETELAGAIAVMWEQRDGLSFPFGGIWILFTPDSEDVDRADLAELKKALRTSAPLPDFDRAYLYPFYRGLKREGGVNSEKYYEEGDSYVISSQE